MAADKQEDVYWRRLKIVTCFFFDKNYNIFLILGGKSALGY
jgi:hypothetical protein